MRMEENLKDVYQLLHDVGNKVYAVLSLSDFGYDGDDKSVYEAELIQLTVAMRNNVRDYYVIVKAFGCCATIWSENIPHTIFSTKEQANNYILAT